MRRLVHLFAGALAVGSFCPAVLALIGYATSHPGLYTWGQSVGMAPNTAFSLCLLSAAIALLTIKWEVGP